MRPTLDQYLMELATVAAKRTTCIKRAVGCVLADECGRVLAIGYNGVASGQPHCNDEVERRLGSVPVNLSVAADNGEYYLAQLQKTFDPGGVVRPRIEPSTVPGHVTVVGFLRPHACKGHNLPSGQDSCEAVHAEQNAMLQCRDPDKINTAYVTTSPCKPCVKLLMNTGCRRIVFLEEHTDPWPKEQWEKLGREWYQLKL